MSMSSIARAANDTQLQNRIKSAAWREMVYDAEKMDSTFGRQVMSGYPSWDQLYWQVAVDTEAAYESALLAGRAAPGFDEDIITDAALTASVSAHWPPEPPAPAGQSLLQPGDVSSLGSS